LSAIPAPMAALVIVTNLATDLPVVARPKLRLAIPLSRGPSGKRCPCRAGRGGKQIIAVVEMLLRAALNRHGSHMSQRTSRERTTRVVPSRPGFTLLPSQCQNPCSSKARMLLTYSFLGSSPSFAASSCSFAASSCSCAASFSASAADSWAPGLDLPDELDYEGVRGALAPRRRYGGLAY
jgi:hypothetical protein